MTDLRLGYALAHPLNLHPGETDDIGPLQSVDLQPDGNLLLSILAVDR